MPDINGPFPITGSYVADKKVAIKTALELGNVDNTADADKPVSTAQAAADDAAQAAAEFTSQAALDTAVGTLNDAIALKADASALTVKISSNHTQAANGTVAQFLSFNNLVFMDQTNAAIIAGNEDPNTVYITVENETP